MTKKRKLKNKAKLIPSRIASVGANSWEPKLPKWVMVINAVNIYGSAAFFASRIPALALQIDLSGFSQGDSQLVNGNGAARAQFPKSLFEATMPIVAINWADGTAHTLDRLWWDTLIAAIKKLPAGSSVSVCCVGGTGRTGTVLAILAGLTNQLGPDYTDPVKWLRDHYYDDAVETDEQLWYVEDITGLMTVAYPSNYMLSSGIVLHETQATGKQVGSQPQEAVTDFLGYPASNGASDHTDS